jgi:hypothetical protein
VTPPPDDSEVIDDVADLTSQDFRINTTTYNNGWPIPLLAYARLTGKRTRQR